MLKRILTSFFAIFILAACVPTAPTIVPVTPTESAPRPWWRDAIFYEIFVRSFYDSDGNGIGDFNGITEKLDYLEELGINALWLMPIHPSPSYHGYDVIDYYEVNPEYGTMDDFKLLLEEAHSRDIRIIIDLVLNHTSSQHEWFVDSNSNRNSQFRDYYVWSDTSGGNGWYEGQNGYYFAFFCDCMPDLNYRNAAVTADMLKVTDTWLNDIGVDGFRVDAAKHLIEDGDVRENTPATHEWYKEFYLAYKAQDPQAYTVGEVFGAGASVVKSYTGDQLDHIFNFEMASGFVNSANGGSNTGISSALKFALQDMPDFNFATFLTNHDQNRLMSVLNGDLGKAKVAATLMLTSPGTPFIYYGEEIGMTGKKPDEDIRLPMQWSDAAGAGFTTGTPWRAPNADYVQVNIAVQSEDPESLLTHYRKLIALRHRYSAIQRGDLHLVETGNSKVYAALRVHGDEMVLVLVNLKDEAISDYALTLKEAVLTEKGYGAEMLFGEGQVKGPRRSDGGFSSYKPRDELSPYGSYIIRFIP